MNLQHAPSPRRSGTYIHELRTQKGRRALAGAALGLQCPSWYRSGTSAGRTAENRVRSARSARRMHPARAFDPACSSGCWWLVAFSESCQCPRCLLPLIPGFRPLVSTTKRAPGSRRVQSRSPCQPGKEFLQSEQQGPVGSRCALEERSSSERVLRANGMQAG